jgi:DNA invertase Pin-like site-specific DNA recombinase
VAYVILYGRESTADQELGLQAQHTRLEHEAAYRSWSDTIYIEDAGYSARSLNRPGIKRALEMLSRGEAHTLVACKLDRLSRSVTDFLALVTLAEQQGWNLIVLDLGLDLASPNGRFVATIMSSVAQLERELIGQRTREALQVKKSQGVKLGRPVRVEPSTREFIVRARSEGFTLTAIADTLTNKGIPTAQNGKKWYPSTISAILASV